MSSHGNYSRGIAEDEETVSSPSGRDYTDLSARDPMVAARNSARPGMQRNSGSFGREGGSGRGTIADTLASARAMASLANPSRPFTPADPLRRLHGQPLMGSNSQPPPPTPLLSVSSTFEPERPFTGLMKTPLPTRPSDAARGDQPQRRQQAAEVMVLSDDDPKQDSPTSFRGRTNVSSEEDLTKEESQTWEAIKDVLPALKVAKGGGGMAGLLEAFGRLELALPDRETVKTLTTAQRSEVVRGVARCLEAKDPQVLAKVAKAILRVTKGGPNLVSASKLVFRLSKSAANDAVLSRERVSSAVLGALEEGRLQSLMGYMVKGNEQCEAELEAGVYLAGTLKNATTDSVENRAELVEAGAVGTLTEWIRGMTRMVREELTEGGREGVMPGERRERLRGQVTAMLAQVTATLRNLATGAGPGGRERGEEFVACGAVRELVGMMSGVMREEREVVLNASRVLAKLSLTKECLEDLASSPSMLRQLVLVLSLPTPDAADAALVRVLFVLGNVTAGAEQARAAVAGGAEEGEWTGIEVLGRMLKEHVARLERGMEGDSRGISSDLLVKLVRLLAHLAISPAIGPELAEAEAMSSLVVLLESVTMEEEEELLLNAISAITNLSFHSNRPNAALWQHRFELAEALAGMLFVKNQEAVLEAARAFGNLSRDHATRAVMHSTRVDEALVLLLDHASYATMAAAAGVIVNLAADPACAVVVMEADGPMLLLDALGRVGEGDNELACTVCHALYNLCVTVEWGMEEVSAGMMLRSVEEMRFAVLTHAGRRRGGGEESEEEGAGGEESLHELELVLERLASGLRSNFPSLPALPSPPLHPIPSGSLMEPLEGGEED